jgi:hypothetical protein
MLDYSLTQLLDQENRHELLRKAERHRMAATQRRAPWSLHRVTGWLTQRTSASKKTVRPEGVAVPHPSSRQMTPTGSKSAARDGRQTSATVDVTRRRQHLVGNGGTDGRRRRRYRSDVSVDGAPGIPGERSAPGRSSSSSPSRPWR